MNPSAPPDMPGMDVLGLHLSNQGLPRASHAHPYASSISSSASSSSSSVFSLDASQSSISSTATNPVDVIWENDADTLGRNPGCPRGFAKGVAPKPDVAVPAEMRMHPRRTNTIPASGPCARPPPCLLRQSERKVNFVDNLVDTASQIVENIWPLSAAASRSDAATGSKGVLPLRTFIQETLRRSRTSYSTLQVALYYLIKIKPHVPAHDFTKEQSRDQSMMRAMQCGRRMFLAALILASKYLQDRNYSARAWSKISGLNTLEINQNELMFLQAVGWRLHICEATFQRWTDLVLKLTPGAGGPLMAEGQCWRTVLPRLTPDLELDSGSEPMTPASGIGGMDLGLSESPSPRSMPSNEYLRSTSREQTPTCPRSLPRTLEPTPRMEFTTTLPPALPRPSMLPTPQMTPQSHVVNTPAASMAACGARRSSIGTAMSQAQNMGLARSTLDQRPPLSFCSRVNSFEGYPSTVRRSSLARSTSSASSPDSMVSDVSTLSSRSSRSSSVSSASGANVLAPPRLAVKATMRCTNNSLKESRKPLAIASPIDESNLVDLYSSPEAYPGVSASVPDLSSYSLDKSLSEAAQSLCELSGATQERRQCRKRGRTGSDDLFLQNHVRHLIDLGATNHTSVVPDGHMASSFMVGDGSALSGPAGMKRACCGSEARKVALNPSIRADFLN